MPRKHQGWITFQSSDDERQLLEQHCQQRQRSKTEVLRELLRSLGTSMQSSQSPPASTHAASTDASENAIAPEVMLFDGPSTPAQPLKLSARNVLRGTITRLVHSAVATEITLEIAPGVELVSVITSASVADLMLTEGKTVYAVIKSNNVMIAVD